MIRDGELVTACQTSCPTEAVVFGKINDLNSRVSKLKATQLTYGLLTDLNMQPRTTYLARLRHPHPDSAQPEERSREASYPRKPSLTANLIVIFYPR